MMVVAICEVSDLKRSIGHIDLNTGEILPNVTLYAITPKKRNGFRNGWLSMATNEWIRLAAEGAPLGRDGFRVFAYVMGVVDYENKLSFSKADAARALGMETSNFTRAFKRIEKYGVVREVGIDGQRKLYLVNPEIAWKGSARNHHAALSAWRKGE